MVNGDLWLMVQGSWLMAIMVNGAWFMVIYGSFSRFAL